MNLFNWLRERAKWWQLAAQHLLTSNELDNTFINKLVELAQQEVNNDFTTNSDYSIPDETFDAHDSGEIRLCTISEVTGVNLLGPRKPLDFGESNIAVVYGENGSGKSGYIRLLKHICGARDRVREQLHKDVFAEKNDVAQKAKVSYCKNSTLEEHEWTGLRVFDDLRSVDIFDTLFDQVFLKNEGETCYEPPVLYLYSRLIAVVNRVAAELDENVKALNLKIKISDDLLGSIGATWVEKLNTETTAAEVNEYCSFTPENETELQGLQKRISEISPAGKATQFRTKKEHADGLISEIKSLLNKLSDENCKRIIAAKKESNLKKLAAETAAKDMFNRAALKGVGSDVWKELWNAALKYSEEVAYIGQEFPYVQGDSVCVLCHQPLSEEAKQRFTSFESYIKGETEKQAQDARREYEQEIDALPDIRSIKALKTQIDAAGIEDQDIINGINNTVTAIQDRKTKVLSLDEADGLDSLNQTPEWIKNIQKISQGYEDRAKQYDEDASKDNRSELEDKVKNLKAKQELAKQKPAIQERLKLRQELNQIQEARKTANSQALSKKKGEEADKHITTKFIDRFNNELKELGASKLKVILTKTNVTKGKILHTIKLDKSKHNLNEVLSEGEKRIISIAAFLADITGRKYPSPCLFDDPISSLGQYYEEAVVKRLCRIAKERQVIVFTHRIPLLVMVQDHADKVKIKPKIICIRGESWGTGEPGDTPLSAKKPANALNALINERLPKARKTLATDGKEDYEKEANSICTDFRIILERMIESELISDIVHRYRPAINTKRKLADLAKISEADCKYFDDLMTKYSSYVHSPPTEAAPVHLPKPDELETDFNALKDWQAEFKKRQLT